jgi:hypothetical protein
MPTSSRLSHINKPIGATIGRPQRAIDNKIPTDLWKMLSTFPQVFCRIYTTIFAYALTIYISFSFFLSLSISIWLHFARFLQALSPASGRIQNWLRH